MKGVFEKGLYKLQYTVAETRFNPQNKNQTEGKAKVVAAGLGAELIQFHAVLEIQR